MLEKNSSLNYLTISSLHKFNQRAIHSLSESLAANTGLKLIDLKRTTRQFFFAMEHGVNTMREELKKSRLIVLRDSVFLTSAHALTIKSKLSRELAQDVHETTFGGGHGESTISSKRRKRTVSSHKKSVIKSRTPEQPLQQSYTARFEQEHRRQTTCLDALENHPHSQVEMLGLNDS